MYKIFYVTLCKYITTITMQHAGHAFSINQLSPHQFMNHTILSKVGDKNKTDGFSAIITYVTPVNFYWVAISYLLGIVYSIFCYFNLDFYTVYNCSYILYFSMNCQIEMTWINIVVIRI